MHVFKLCQKAKLVKLGTVALDGTKVKANASKHKAMSYGRMKEKERELEQKVAELLKRAEVVDEAEDRTFGKGKRGDELPEELRFHTKRLQKIREAKALLEAEARAEGLQEKKRRDTGDPPLPPDKAQKNFTDPESRILKDNATKSFVQGYNAQVAVDAKAQVIVAADVTQEAVDKQQFIPMLQKVKAQVRRYPKQVLADAGYCSEKNVACAQTKRVDAYLATGRIKHTAPLVCPKGRIPKEATLLDRMRRKLRTKQGQHIYAKRKEVAEPVFGQIKQARGFRQFLLRGLEKVQAEWQMICLTHNLLKLYRYAWIPARS